MLVGVFGVRRRRLEYAGALHSGQSKGAQLLGIGVETGVWAGLATVASCALLLAYAVRMSRSDLGGGVGGCGAYAVGCVRRCDGGEPVCRVVDSGIAVVPFLQEALTGLRKRNNSFGVDFGWWLGDGPF